MVTNIVTQLLDFQNNKQHLKVFFSTIAYDASNTEKRRLLGMKNAII